MDDNIFYETPETWERKKKEAGRSLKYKNYFPDSFFKVANFVGQNLSYKRKWKKNKILNLKQKIL